MSSSDSETDQLIARKRKLNPSNYRGNEIKLGRCRGEVYLSHSGKIVPAKVPEKSCG